MNGVARVCRMANDWHQVANRRQQHKRKTDGTGIRDRGSQHGNVDKMSTPFYVTNLPKDIKTNELWNKCAILGTVVDVYIAQKLSKMGRRFAFVLFIKVRNTNDLEARLCDMWFGNYHIFASIARFPKKDNTQSIPQPDNVRNTSRNVTHASQMAAKSYATAVTGDKMAKQLHKRLYIL